MLPPLRVARFTGRHGSDPTLPDGQSPARLAADRWSLVLRTPFVPRFVFPLRGSAAAATPPSPSPVVATLPPLASPSPVVAMLPPLASPSPVIIRRVSNLVSIYLSISSLALRDR